jgi:hypothetical protein
VHAKHEGGLNEDEEKLLGKFNRLEEQAGGIEKIGKEPLTPAEYQELLKLRREATKAKPGEWPDDKRVKIKELNDRFEATRNQIDYEQFARSQN